MVFGIHITWVVLECSTKFQPNCSRFHKWRPFSFEKNHIFALFSKSILFFATKLARGIALGKWHLVQECGLKWPWPWEVEAILKVTIIAFLYFFWPNKPRMAWNYFFVSGEFFLFLNILCNFYQSFVFYDKNKKHHMFALCSKSILVNPTTLGRDIAWVRGHLVQGYDLKWYWPWI